MAHDFAELEVLEEAVADKLLPQKPDDNFNPLDQEARQNFFTLYHARELAITEFKRTDHFKNNVAILRTYVDDFFGLCGCEMPYGKISLPDNWEEFDYLEGPMIGGDKIEWEIKFNRRREIYALIKLTLSSQEEINFPMGSKAMLDAYQEASNQENKAEPSRGFSK